MTTTNTPDPVRTPMQRTILNVTDGALISGGTTVPLWLQNVHDYGQVALVIIGVGIGLARLKALFWPRRPTGLGEVE
jgi:hypothetical protein